MLADLLAHETQLSQILSQKLPAAKWQALACDHRWYLDHLQHERLAHLLVTLTVVLASLLVAGLLFFVPSIWLAILLGLLISLLIPYLIHYQRLENTTQRWYKLTTQLESKLVNK